MGLLRGRSVELGVISMVLLVFGTLAPAGSSAQKLLFLVPAPVLGYTAYVAGQKLFTVLQCVVTVGAALAFLEGGSEPVKYGLLVGCALAGLSHLTRSGYWGDDRWGLLGAAGILLLSFGYATDALAHPLGFNILLGAGGLLVAAYSAIAYFHKRVVIAFIWLALNMLFVVNPLMTALSLLGLEF